MQVIKINLKLVAFIFDTTSPRLQIRVITEDRRNIADIKVGELPTYTDNVINPKHTAGCCGTLSGQLLAAMDHLKGLVYFHYAFSVFVGLSFRFSSKWLFLTVDQSFLFFL